MVADIPPGRVTTYGDIAACVGHPGAGRIVGLIAHNGSGDLPWQRVVNHSGGLASGYEDGREGQAAALEAEGVKCQDGRVVDFATLRWTPDDDPTPRVLLLRAVNVGGATLPMADLRAMAGELGATDVSTYIASGNLICTPPGDAADFDRALEAAIQVRFGFVREVISRTPAELRAALRAYPFDRGEPKWCYIYFLSATPTAEATAALQSKSPEDVAVIGKDLHIRYRGGVAASKLTTKLIHQTLGVVGTGRNLATIEQIVVLNSPP